MKRSRLRRVSKKRRAREREAKPVRDQLIAEVGRCEVCGHDPRHVRSGYIAWRLGCQELACHEIANGPLRQKALDKRFALLVVCWLCNSEELTDRKRWPEARQLAWLKSSRPQDYNLAEYVRLKYPNSPGAITEEEVEEWL